MITLVLFTSFLLNFGISSSRARRKSFKFLACKNEFGIGFWIDKKLSGAENDIVVLMNGDPTNSVHFELPDGEWSIIVNEEKAGVDIIQAGVVGELQLTPTSGMVMVK